MSYNNDITAEAYNATKPKEDPLFADCNLDFQQKLSTHAESVARVGLPENPSEFEKCVKDLLDNPDKARRLIVKTKEEEAKRAAEIMTEAGKRKVEEVEAQVAAEKKALEDSKKADHSGDKEEAARRKRANDDVLNRVKGTAGITPLATAPQSATSVPPSSAKSESSGSPVSDSGGSTRQGKLPEDFPHRAALEAADIHTYAQARKAHDSGWADAHGIGESKGKEIGDALKD